MKLAILTLALVPFAAVLVGPSLASASQSADCVEALVEVGALNVVVTDPIAHLPVKNGVVRVIPFGSDRPILIGITDSHGIFHAGVLPAGPYVIEVRTFIDRAHRKLQLVEDFRNVVHLEVFSEIDP